MPRQRHGSFIYIYICEYSNNKHFIIGHSLCHRLVVLEYFEIRKLHFKRDDFILEYMKYSITGMGQLQGQAQCNQLRLLQARVLLLLY